nr:C40 family peptidase [Pseudomonas sp.]
MMAVLSGCASTTPPQQQAAGDINGLLAYRDSDQMSALLHRIEQRGARNAYNHGITHGHGIIAPEAALADQALDFLGTSYKYGGESPSGFDCSGLVWYVANETLGLKLPRTAADQAKLGTKVARAELQRGDLVFFNTMGRRYSHVGIYLGGGEFVHAPSTGGKVRVEKLATRYWNTRYNGARRISDLIQLAAN